MDLPSHSIWPHIQCGCCLGKTAPSTPRLCSSARSSPLADHWSEMALQRREDRERKKRDEFGDYSLIQYKYNGSKSFLENIRNRLSLLHSQFLHKAWWCRQRSREEDSEFSYKEDFAKKQALIYTVYPTVFTDLRWEGKGRRKQIWIVGIRGQWGKSNKDVRREEEQREWKYVDFAGSREVTD